MGRIRHLGNQLQKLRVQFLLAPVSPTSLSEKKSCGLHPILENLSHGCRVMPVVGIFPMGHHAPFGIARQEDFEAAFMLFACLVFGDAVDMRVR